MLRPATPLAVLFLIAFVLLLLATLSTPIIKAIPLASFGGVDFGVFGYCQKSGTSCSGIRVGYSTDQLFDTQDDNDFSLPASARHSLSSILIVHPIAALLTLICFIMAFAAHFQGPAHSPKYLMALVILTFPTLLVALLAFLVDILLFVPHMAWGGWIVLAATILIIASGIVTCAMRRTLVSRKARKKRIAENADMNGQNYYANTQQPPRMLADELPRAESPPPMSGGLDHGDKTPQFATFETSTMDRKSSDDRTPLNPRAHSIRSASSGPGGRIQPMNTLDGAPPMPNQLGREQQRDQYGNFVSPGEIAMANDLPPPGLRHHTSRGSLGSNGSNRSQRSGGSPGGSSAGPMGPPPPGYRGRGGYAGPPRGRGGYGPRGNFGPGPRGGYGPGRGMPYRGRGGPQGMRGPPPPGWQVPPPMGRGMAPGPGAMAGMPMMARGQQGQPPGYGAPYGAERDMPPPGLPPFARSNGSPTPPPHDDAGIGQAIEMDERTGSPPVSAPMNSIGQYGAHEGDGEVAGMQGRRNITPANQRDITPTSQRQASGNEIPTPSSIYSQQPYVPARNNWAPPVPVHGGHEPVSPIDTSHPMAATNGQDLSPIQPSPQMRHHRTTSDSYYEDVDPQFASDPNQLPTIGVAHASPTRESFLPNSLVPGSQGPIPQQVSGQHLSVDDAQHAVSLDRDSSYENIAEGARSPAGSDASHFTSISQRGVNPNWRPGPPTGMAGPGPNYGGPNVAHRRNERNEMILGGNPDFSIPGMGPPRQGGGGGYRGRGGPMGMRPSPGAGGMTPQGRYPTDL